MPKIFVCLACGKMSKDKFGKYPISYGWDVSCTVNSVEIEEEKLVIKDGRVKEIKND